jgi:hypothetical protein
LFKETEKRHPILCIFLSVIIATIFIPTVFASQEIVGSDYNYGTQLGISLIVYKDTGEQDPNYDYYAVKVLLADIMYQNDPWTSPYLATVRIAVPTYAGEPPGSHSPPAGFQMSQNRVNFGYQGIGVSILIPACRVSYSTSSDANFRYFDWTVDGDGWWFIFDDYAEFIVGIRVPQGYNPTIYAGGWVAWYSFYGLVFAYHSQESYYWLQVTAPGMLLLNEQLPTMSEIPKLYKRIPKLTKIN